MNSNRGCFENYERRQIGKIIFLILPLIFTILLFTPLYAEDKTKTLIGGVEEVVLFPWGVKLPARIDTGASMTSLDVRDLTVKKGMAEFRLPQQYGNTLIRLPIMRHCGIRSSDARERRPVVEMELCIGSRRMQVEVNLNDRSRMEYPLILGRNVLNLGFIVDSAQEKILPPKCLEEVSR
ncbi:MAG: ATP-dependent zinc protease [Thermodesulfobacteriota bacterium]